MQGQEEWLEVFPFYVDFIIKIQKFKFSYI